ncbi:ABC multidrug transporter MDR5 [Cladobotryum mycophilum]|uniref:ABC multidrug transporter MDR5 n=1 Tax=Cladobotryum mycophilum TaxID=491253 RepID=A0ABR0SU87_9HYPO
MDETTPPRPQEKDNQETKDALRSVNAPVQLWHLASPTDRLLYFAALLCSVGSGTIMPLMTLIFGNFVTIFNDFSLGDISKHEFLSHISHYAYISMVLFTIVSANVTSSLQQTYLRAVLAQRIAFHETKLRSGIVNEALSSHSNAIRSGLSDKFGMTVQHTSTIITGFVVALVSIWNLALAVASIVPAAVIVIGAISVFDEKLEQQIRAQKEEASTLAEEVFSSVRTVRSLGRAASDKMFEKYGKFLNRATELGWKRAPIYGIQIGTYMFLLYCAYALAFWYGVHLYSTGQVDKSGKVITTLFSIMIGMNSFSQLAAYLGPFMSIFSSVNELFKIISAPVDGGFANSGDLTDETFQQDIVFTDVAFRYPTRPTAKVLDSLTLNISGGKKIAFVGQSGCGKSMIVGLLLRWYDVESGTMSIGGVDIADISTQAMRSKIGFVSQEPQLFSGTIFENVANGLLGSSSTHISNQEKTERVIGACKVANAHDFITQLPQGYETNVGDRGTQLSGGQKQRLAIAPTSALDPASEAVIQKAIESASQNRTIISIAHRLQTIQKSDHIYVLGRQSILEKGNHESLLASPDSLYKRLWTAQSLEAGSEIRKDGEVTEMELTKHVSTAPSMRTGAPEIETRSETHENKGTISIFFMIISQYRSFWLAYAGLVIGSIIAGALYPIQAVLYAKVVDAFQLNGKPLTSAGNFWALMWFVLALVVALGYMSLSGLGAGLGEMISQDYRATYFNVFTHQSIAFFDERTNSPGSLIARLSTDPEAIKEFAGGNITVLITVAVSLIGTITLALVIGWKFALVVLAGGLPFIFAASYVREKMEHTFEENAGKVFNDCVGYASECV